MSHIPFSIQTSRPKTAPFHWLQAIRWPTRLATAVFIGDLLLIAAHLLLVYTPLLTDGNFQLQREAGYAEWFQYLKFAAAIGLLWVTYRRHKQPLYLAGLLLFGFLLLDDAGQLHEKIGLWLAETAHLPALFALRARDLGELLFMVTSGLALLCLLLLAYQQSSAKTRPLLQSLLPAIAGLAAVGIVGDMLHQMASRPWLRQLLLVVEDGGEILMGSVLLWLVYQHAEQINQWSAKQTAVWWQTAVTGLGLLFVCTAVLALIQYSSPAIVGNDGHYHARMGLLVRQQGLTPTPPQLPLTILNQEDFYNHHLLYHLYLALFTQTEPAHDGGIGLIAQAKAATTLMAALPFVAVWWLLRGQKVGWPVLWSLLLFALSSGFLYRLSMVRAQSASLLVLIVALHYLLHGRFRPLLPLGFIYVWLYDGFPLLILLAGVYATAVAICHRRWPWAALLYPAAGILLGLIINPYFPQNIIFIGHHLLAKLWDSQQIPVGNEWAPYQTWTLLQNAGLALGLFLLTLFGLNWHGKRMNSQQLTLFLLTLVFGLMLFRSRRFVEYFPAFVLLFAALSLSPMVAQWHAQLAQRPWAKAWQWLLLVGLLLPASYTVRQTQTAVAANLPADHYRAALLWLDAYSQPGSTVFQTDWDDFPRLFFYAPSHHYTVGLDPTYLSLQDLGLYQQWVQITQGQARPLSRLIQQQFDADYVFTDRKHTAFLEEAAHDPGLQQIYSDDTAVIFAVLP